MRYAPTAILSLPDLGKALVSFECVAARRNKIDCSVEIGAHKPGIGCGGADLGVQRAVADGLIEGPQLRIAITVLSQTAGHGDGWLPSGLSVSLRVPHPGRPGGIVDGPEEMRKRVREIVRAGADVIKVCTSGGVLSPRDSPQHAHFRPDELAVLVAEATAAGLPVMAHAQATDGIKNAIRAGIGSIEHGIYLDDEAIGMMLAAGTWLVPTLIAPIAVLEAAQHGSQLPDGVAAKAQDVIAAHRESFAKAVAAGVKVAMGTDSGVGPHGQNLRELSLMESGGMTPAQVLAATTSSAAELLGLAEHSPFECVGSPPEARLALELARRRGVTGARLDDYARRVGAVDVGELARPYVGVADEHGMPAHVADGGTRLPALDQRCLEAGADARDVVRQAVALDDVEHRHADGRLQRT